MNTKPEAAWRSQDFTGYNQGEVIQEVYIRNIRNNAKTPINSTNKPVKKKEEAIVPRNSENLTTMPKIPESRRKTKMGESH